MSMFDQGIHRVVKVTTGTQVVRIPNLKSGTLYAILLKGHYGTRSTDVVTAATGGSGYSLMGSLNSNATALQTSIQNAYGVAAPHGYFVAGSDANLSRLVPQLSLDNDSTTATNATIRVAVPDFNSPTDSAISAMRCRISRDGGVSYNEVQEIPTPFPDGLNYAVFNLSLPYDTEAFVIFQARYKDGTYGRQTRPWQLYGCKRPDTLPLASPTLGTITGAKTYEAGKVNLAVTVPVTADPAATDILVQLYDGSGNLQVSNMVPNVVNTAVNVILANVPTNVATYTVKAYSVQSGSKGAVATTTWSVSSASAWKPSAFDTAKIFLSEVIERKDGYLQSKVRVVFLSAISTSQPQGNVYMRKKDGKALASLVKGDFTLKGCSAGDFTTEVISDAGAGVVYQFVVLAVGPDGSEADFTTAQVKECNVFQYSNYVPPQQSVPTIKVLGDKSVQVDGTYVRIADSPEPQEIRAYKSETSTADADLVAKAAYVNAGSGNYTYTLTIPDFTVFSVGSGNNDITLRTFLENGGLTLTTAKTTVRVIQALPAAPALGSAAAYVKTVRATITNIAARTVSAQTAYTPTSGNGGKITITAAADTIKVEVSDSGTPGTNPEYITPSVDINNTNAYLVFTPSINTNTRNVRAKFCSVYGDTGWSNAIQVTFPDAPVVDTTCNISACYPRFTCNADGTITIAWSAGSFGNSQLGSYLIRRSKTNNPTTSAVVGIVTKSDVLNWTDNLALDHQEITYYYWLEATNAQGFFSAAPVAVKLQSANTWAAETVVAAASHRTTAPSAPTGLVVKGAQGGFNITWNTVPERVKDYVVEWSALGTFADTIAFYVAGNTFFQTDGASAPKATADAYRWRVKARDAAGNLSAVSSTATPDNTNYGSVQDSAPQNPTSVTLTGNTDGSITLSITAPADTARTYFKVVRRSKSTTFVDGDAGVTDEASFMVSSAGTTTTHTDTGLSPDKFYNYRVSAASKLGTLSVGYASGTTTQVKYNVKGILRPNLITNGHFGTAGTYGNSTVGWTLGSGVTTVSQGGNYTYNTTGFSLMRFVRSGVTSAVVLSQTFQVIPGKRYTVLGSLYYAPTTADGRAYIRVASAGTLYDASAGATTSPAPYPVNLETSGTDFTTVRSAHRFISYSFIAPAGVSQMTLNIGFENRTATDQVVLYPGFIQVYLDE